MALETAIEIVLSFEESSPEFRRLNKFTKS